MNLDGLMVADHTVPAGCVALYPKFCENCGKPFARKPTGAGRPVLVSNGGSTWITGAKSVKTRGNATRFLVERVQDSVVYKDTGQRYCGSCQASMLLPPDKAQMDNYKAQLPDANIAHRSYHLPHYDQSLRRAVSVPRTRAKLGNWTERLVSALSLRGPMSYADMVTVTGHKNTVSLASSLRYSGVTLKPVGHVYPRLSCMGTSPQLYALVKECNR